MTAPLARISHRIPGRARLRTQGIKGDRAAVNALLGALEETPGVKNVQVSLTTGSVLVEHDGDIEDVLHAVEQRGALQVEEREPEPYLTQINRALVESDRRLQQASKGKVNLETISFVGFVAGGVYQVFNNHGLPAGVTMLRYAVELVTSKALDHVRTVAKLSAEAPPEG